MSGRDSNRVVDAAGVDNHDFIGQALGPYLLASAIDIAWSYEPEKLLVNTNTLDHPKALALYQRMGFRPYKREKRRIDDPRLLGLVPG